MRLSNIFWLVVAVAVIALPVPAAEVASQLSVAELQDGFRSPPESAKPRTWWHWTKSNVTKAGITKDLEWMKRVGIGGFMLADVNYGQGQEVDPKTPFGTPEWYEAVRHAAAEADRLGLEMAIFSSPGWSETGGPWVKPEQAMKKLVWSATHLKGPTRFSGNLPPPPSNNGQIRNTGATYYGGPTADPTHYADSAVIAYRTPQDEATPSTSPPRVTSHHGAIDGSALLDDDLNSTLTLEAPTDGSAAWVQFEYAQPFVARALTIGGKGGSANGIPVGRVLASDDGQSFRTILTLPGAQLYRQSMVRTYAFEPVRAKYFRIEMTGAPLGPAVTMSQAPSPPARNYVLSEAVLHSGARVHRWEEKAGFGFLFEYDTVPTPAIAPADSVAMREVIDLSAKMKADGLLEWDAPAGDWTVLRMGFSLTGAKNRPATAAGSGYEADKLSREHMTAYFHGYFDPLQTALGPLFGKSLRYVMMDSWEAGTNNWSDAILTDFRARRGYDPTPYLPVLTGRVVENAELSDRFLWDFRRTLADLWAENHYGTMADLLRERGIGIYAEAAGVSLEMPEDTLLNKSKVEIPMGEFWVRDLHPRLMYLQDVRGAASAAHAYGKRLVASEAFTGGGYESPYTLKKVGDYWLAQGVNRMVFHTSAHQPLDSPPGNTMVGTHIHRNITWAGQAGPLMTYFARNSFLLQQGLFVADVAYLLNEGAPSTPPIWGAGTLPTPPPGFDFDFINADVLLNRMSVAPDGRFTLPDGMSYRVLVLPQTREMRPALMAKLRELVRGGGIVVGPRPLRSPSLSGYPAADAEVRARAEELWGDLDGVSRTIRHFGKGKVIWGWPLDRVMAMEGVVPDFESSRGLDTDLAWLHRRVGDVDIYYVANLTDHAQEVEARVRVAGREAEIWRTDDGAIQPATYHVENAQTRVSVHLDERETAFLVFPRATGAGGRVVPATRRSVLSTIAGSWEVDFTATLTGGAPARYVWPKLESWTLNAHDGIKFYSGTAVYHHTLDASADWFKPGTALWLNLGQVADVAELFVNGHSMGILWKAPYEVDVSGAMKAGANKLEIRITNEWTNRLLGDSAALPDKKVLASSVVVGRRGNAPAEPATSGLLGPVTVEERTK